jgi:hypothetical protein
LIYLDVVNATGSKQTLLLARQEIGCQWLYANADMDWLMDKKKMATCTAQISFLRVHTLTADKACD